MVNKKLTNIATSILWGVALLVTLAQGYRAISYYIFDKPIDWTWHDAVVFGLSFMVMFVPSKLKTIIVNTATRITNKKQ
jgi:hypothetical protein